MFLLTAEHHYSYLKFAIIVFILFYQEQIQALTYVYFV